MAQVEFLQHMLPVLQQEALHALRNAGREAAQHRLAGDDPGDLLCLAPAHEFGRALGNPLGHGGPLGDDGIQQIEGVGEDLHVTLEIALDAIDDEGDFLEQNPYEEWTIYDRERLRVAYLDTIERMSQIYFHQESYAACITVCQRMLTYDPCREDAYCLLMRCYSRQGQDHLALRQYQACVKALQAEMDVEPAPETTRLYNRIRRHEPV